jgi:hypothetical protein
MLKLQLTLLLQLNRCPRQHVCYKIANRVTVTRPFGSRALKQASFVIFTRLSRFRKWGELPADS